MAADALSDKSTRDSAPPDAGRGVAETIPSEEPTPSPDAPARSPDAPAPSPEEPTPSPDPPAPRRRSRAKIALAVLAALLIVCGVVGALEYRRVVTWYVIRECRIRGVQVDPASIELTSSMVRLRDTRFTLLGVPSLGAHADTIEVELAKFAPTHVAMHGLGIELNGPVGSAVDEAGQWATAYRQSYELPLQVDDLTVLWREERKSLPWLSFQKATLAPEPGGARLKTSHLTIWGKTFNQVVTTWKSDMTEVAIGIGADDPASAPIRIDLMRGAPYSLKVAWKRAPLVDLASILGITMPPRGISAEGSVELRGTDLMAPLDGSLHLVLHNFVPPHPAELNTVVTGNHTTIDSKLTVSQDRSRLGLSETKVVAGSFQLDGTGQVQRVENYGLIGLKLSGTIQCSSISLAAAAGRLGKLGSLLGGLIGEVAQHALIGVITVGVNIEADTRAMDAIKVEDRVGIGCRLRLL